jgi:hypothetical protein
MNARALSKLWTVLGSVLLFYTLNAWLQSQGGGLLFKVAILDEREVPNAYFSIIICGTLLTVLCLIGSEFARISAGLSRFGRWPVVELEELDFGDRSARVYQVFFLLIFVAVPLGAIVHFWDEMISHGAVFRKDIVVLAPASGEGGAARLVLEVGGDADAPVKFKPIASIGGPVPPGKTLCLASWQGGNEGLSTLLYARALADEGRVPSARVAHDPCRDSEQPKWYGGVTWLPVLSPVLLLTTTLGGLGMSLRLFWSIVR